MSLLGVSNVTSDMGVTGDMGVTTLLGGWSIFGRLPRLDLGTDSGWI